MGKFSKGTSLGQRFNSRGGGDQDSVYVFREDMFFFFFLYCPLQGSFSVGTCEWGPDRAAFNP